MLVAIRGMIEDETDIIFMDPPYDQEYEKQVLELLKDMAYVTKKTLIVIEASLQTDFSYVTNLGFQIIKQKLYKSNKHIFLQRR